MPTMTGRTYRLCVIPGDGIGQEVIPAAVQVLRALPLSLHIVEADAGFATFQRRGVSVPPETLEAIRASDAALFGAVSSPMTKVEGYSSAVVTLRRQLDLYANLRPIRSLPLKGTRPHVDMLIVRENTEDLYIGQEQRYPDRAVAQRLITVRGCERILRYAFETARRQGRRRVTIVHKATILKETCGLFREVGLRMAQEYPDITTDEMLVDTAAMRLITDPERFDVLVTTNLFGDILSDEACALVGGLGLAASGNLGDQAAIFEPVHGSAPDIAGMGIANPLAAILAAAMLLDHIGEAAHAQRVRTAVERVLDEGRVLPPDLGGMATTQAVTHRVIEELSN
jgi:homoisocitrate dehydrogenase